MNGTNRTASLYSTATWPLSLTLIALLGSACGDPQEDTLGERSRSNHGSTSLANGPEPTARRTKGVGHPNPATEP